MLADFKTFMISEGVFLSHAFSPESFSESVIAPFHLKMSFAIVSNLTHDRFAGLTVSLDILVVFVTALIGLHTCGSDAYCSNTQRFSVVNGLWISLYYLLLGTALWTLVVQGLTTYGSWSKSSMLMSKLSFSQFSASLVTYTGWFIGHWLTAEWCQSIPWIEPLNSPIWSAFMISRFSFVLLVENNFPSKNCLAVFPRASWTICSLN